MFLPTTQRSDEELAQYDAGYSAYFDNKPFNTKHLDAWQLGWLDACEYDDPSSTTYYSTTYFPS